MAQLAIFPSVRSADKVPLDFGFGDQLRFGETISGQAVVATVFSGTDANPSAILFDSPTVDGDTVTQIVFGGVDGVIYQLVCAVTGSGGHVYSRSGKLAITESPEQFTG